MPKPKRKTLNYSKQKVYGKTKEKPECFHTKHLGHTDSFCAHFSSNFVARDFGSLKDRANMKKIIYKEFS